MKLIWAFVFAFADCWWRLKYFLHPFMCPDLISLCLIFAGLQIPRRFPVSFGRVLSGFPTRSRLERTRVTREKIITISHLCIRSCGSKGNVNNHIIVWDCQSALEGLLGLSSRPRLEGAKIQEEKYYQNTCI